MYQYVASIFQCNNWGLSFILIESISKSDSQFYASLMSSAKYALHLFILSSESFGAESYGCVFAFQFNCIHFNLFQFVSFKCWWWWWWWSVEWKRKRSRGRTYLSTIKTKKIHGIIVVTLFWVFFFMFPFHFEYFMSSYVYCPVPLQSVHLCWHCAKFCAGIEINPYIIRLTFCIISNSEFYLNLFINTQRVRSCSKKVVTIW